MTNRRRIHRSSGDRILGLEQMLLGLARATVLNFERLIAEKRFSNPSKFTPLRWHEDLARVPVVFERILRESVSCAKAIFGTVTTSANPAILGQSIGDAHQLERARDCVQRACASIHRRAHY